MIRSGPPLPLPEAVEHRLDHLLQGEPALHVQLGREPHLRVDHAVGGQVLGALGRHPGQRLRRLHDRHRVLERVQVVLEMTAVGARRSRGRPRRRRPRQPVVSRSRGPVRRQSPAAGHHQGDRAAAPWDRPDLVEGRHPPIVLPSCVERQLRAGAVLDDREPRGGGLRADLDRARQGLQARAEALPPSSALQLQDGLARLTRSPGLARQMTPAAALTGSSLRARPAPSRQAAEPDRPRVQPAQLAGRGRGHQPAQRGARQRRVRVAALGRDHRPVRGQRPAVGQRRRRVARRARPAGSICRPAPAPPRPGPAAPRRAAWRPPPRPRARCRPPGRAACPSW